MAATKNQLLPLLIRDLPCAFAILDRELSYLHVSDRWLNDFGAKRDKITGLKHYDAFPGSQAHWRDVCARVLDGETIEFEEKIRGHENFGLRWVEWRVGRWRDDAGSTSGIVITARDISKRKAAEAAERESERFLSRVIDSAPIAVITIDESGTVLTFSKAAEKIFGYHADEVINGNVNILMTEAHKSTHGDYIKHYIKTGEERIIGQQRRLTARRKCGQEFPVAVTIAEFQDGKRIFVGFIDDISAEIEASARARNLQDQLHHAGRIGAIGELATTIAHEINQPLTAAASLAGAAAIMIGKDQVSECREAKELIDDAVSEMRRASEIVANLRNFARKRKSARSLVDVNAIIRDASAIALIGAANGDIEVEYALEEDVGAANLNRLEIQQVVTNLILNAIDAMKDSQVRRLRISTGRRDGRIEIAVADSGRGISPSIRDTLFEPFATDKEDGLGVGLSISRSIIDAHHGEIVASDNIPNGAIFTIRLPIGGE